MERRFEVSARAGFDYITEPANWPEYGPPFVRWRDRGDRARLTLRMLGRDVELDMTLARRDPCRVVEYTSEQRGIPAARHWPQFDDADGHLAYRITIEYPPRAGWRGVLDRTLVRAAIARTARETMDNLQRRVREEQQRPVAVRGDPATRTAPDLTQAVPETESLWSSPASVDTGGLGGLPFFYRGGAFDRPLQRRADRSLPQRRLL